MGENTSGQLGDGTTTNRFTPVQIESSGIQNFAAGYYHSIFIKEDTSLWVMGENADGQLGIGSTADQLTPVSHGIGYASAAAGYNHSIFVKTDGSIFTTGNNSNGQLGDGTITAQTSPVKILDGVVFALVAGEGDTDNAKFEFDGNELRSTETLGAGQYSMRIQATYSTGGAYVEVLSITINSVNSPTISAPATASGDEDGTIAFVAPGQVTTLAGGYLDLAYAEGSGADARFNWSYDVVSDSQGNIFVADRNNNRVRIITPDGTVSTFAGSGTASSVDGTGTAATFKSPMGLAIDDDDNLYVISLSSKKVRKITPAGVVTTLAGSGAQGNTDGSATTATFHLPYDLTYDSANHFLYVGDNSGDRIRKINLNLDSTSSSFVTTLAGGTGGYQDGTGTEARFEAPGTLAVDSQGNIYVGDVANYRIRKVTPEGVVTTIAGNGQTTSVDGEGTNASFGKPRGIMVYDDNTLYVSDENNYIRKIELDKNNLVSTVVGDGTPGN